MSLFDFLNSPDSPFKIVRIYPDPPDAKATRAYSTEELKALWDQWDGINDVGGVSGETIHRVLNERGEGFYCAV